MLRLKRVSKLLILFLLFYTIAYADKIKVNKVSDATGGGISANDTAYGAGWNGSTTEVPSQNAVYDKMETLGAGSQTPWTSDINGSTFNLTTSGIIAANGGNSTSWNTAYAYGNWSSQGFQNLTQILALANLTNYFNKTTDIPLGANTSGNYVASVATTAPLTGGAAGSEGAALTIVIPKATAAADGYLNMTDWTTFNNSIDTEVDPTVDTSAEILAIIGANAITGTQVNESSLSIKNNTKSFVVYNITNTTDFFIPPISSKATTITSIQGYCDGGTDVTGVLMRCNTTAKSCTVVDNTTWIFTNGTVVADTSFTNTSILAGGWLKWNTNITNGTPTFFGLGWEYDVD